MQPFLLRGLAIVLVTTVSLGKTLGDSNWPGWRGPLQNGHSRETGFPHQWNADDVTWKTDLKGEGQSSPVLWEERIFLTRSENRGRERFVLCLDRNDGRILWEKSAWTGVPEPSRGDNGWASATCATDGKHVFAFFGRGGGLHCFTVDGDHVWSTGLGEFESPWGVAASPMLVDNLVIQNCDADRDAYIAGLDQQTGEIVWKTKRDDNRGWSTPVLIETGKRREVVVNGHTGVRSYDPATGDEFWFCKSFNGRGTPTVTPHNGLLHVVNGLRGDTYAIQPGGNGNVTDTHMAWHTPRRGRRDLPSPIIVDGQLLIMSKGGILTAYDPGTGKEQGQVRIGGDYWASPIAIDGLAVFIDVSGTCVVIEPGQPPKVVAKNDINASDEETFRASVTPSDGQLFLRSDRMLYCIGKRKSTTD